MLLLLSGWCRPLSAAMTEAAGGFPLCPFAGRRYARHGRRARPLQGTVPRAHRMRGWNLI